MSWKIKSVLTYRYEGGIDRVCVCMCVQTNGQVGEDAERALQKSDQVDQVVAGRQGPAPLHRYQPIVIDQLQELIDLGIQAGVDLRLRRMTGILQEVRGQTEGQRDKKNREGI